MNQEQKKEDIAERLKKHPKLLARVEELLGVVENAGGDIKKASEAEMRVIEEVRQMGHEALRTWATGQAEKVSEEANKREGVRRAGKKNCAGTARSASSN
jgi:hypothetical protein